MKFYKNFIKTNILILIILGFSFLTFKLKAADSNFNQVIYPITQCNDGIDNDGDGGIDFATDPQCSSWLDDDESSDPVTPTPTSSVTPTVSPTTTPIPTQQPSPGFIGPGEIIQQISNDIKDTGGDITKLVQKYLYEPLGVVLGTDEKDSIDKALSENYALRSRMLMISCGCLIGIYYLIILLLILWLKKIKSTKNKK